MEPHYLWAKVFRAGVFSFGILGAISSAPDLALAADHCVPLLPLLPVQNRALWPLMP